MAMPTRSSRATRKTQTKNQDRECDFKLIFLKRAVAAMIAAGSAGHWRLPDSQDVEISFDSASCSGKTFLPDIIETVAHRVKTGNRRASLFTRRTVAY